MINGDRPRYTAVTAAAVAPATPADPLGLAPVARLPQAIATDPFALRAFDAESPMRTRPVLILPSKRRTIAG